MNLLSYFFEGMFPFSCCSCNKIGSLLCDDCYNLIEFSVLSPNPPDPINSITAAVKYTPSIQKLIHQLKFGGIKEAGFFCARLIQYTCSLPKIDVITSVPLHSKRQKNRGYNQSEIIARELSKLTSVPYQPLLRRCKATKAQATTHSKKERQENLHNAFELMPDAKNLHNQSILIVDDVFTTGSTLAECAKTLQCISPKEIHAVTVAARN